MVLPGEQGTGMTLVHPGRPDVDFSYAFPVRGPLPDTSSLYLERCLFSYLESSFLPPFSFLLFFSLQVKQFGEIGSYPDQAPYGGWLIWQTCLLSLTGRQVFLFTWLTNIFVKTGILPDIFHH